MNIAVLSLRLPRAGSKRGGVERVAHELSNGLMRRGHRVTAWSLDPRPDDAEYEVRPLPFARHASKPLLFRFTSGYLGNLLALSCRYGRPDVILAHGDSLLLPLRGFPVLRVMHGSALDEARTARSVFRRAAQLGVFVQERITASTQMTVGVSSATQARYPSIRRIVWNGVDTRLFFPGTAKSQEPTLLFVGTLAGRKRGMLLIDWFRQHIRRAIADARLWMVTEPGPAVEGVEYCTGIATEHLADLFRRAWVFVSPSTYEGFGLPYLEAMASGTPVIATTNPGSREVLDEGRAGVLVGDDRELPNRMLRMLQSAREREVWAERGLRRAGEFTLDASLDRYEALLQMVAERATRRTVAR